MLSKLCDPEVNTLQGKLNVSFWRVAQKNWLERVSSLQFYLSIIVEFCVSTEWEKFQASLLRMIYTIILGKTNVSDWDLKGKSRGKVPDQTNPK